MIKFDRTFVGTNSAEFQHGINLFDFRSWLTQLNFGLGWLVRIRSNFGYLIKF